MIFESMNKPLSLWSNISRVSGFSMLFVFILLLAFSGKTFAQDDPEYDEIAVFMMIQGVGAYEFNAIYMDDRVYVPTSDLFGLLKINHNVSAAYDSISGFFLNEQNRYLINARDYSIKVGSSVFQFDKAAMLITPTGMYLRNDVFGKAFGLNLNFNFRSLSLELKTSLELPVIKELRLEQMRKNVNRLRGEVAVDTTIRRNYHLFRGGMADWSVIASQNSGGRSDTRASLALGAEFLGGETNILLNYSSQIGFDERQQQYRWRWANNDAKIVRQVTAGKIQPRSIASIYAPVIGVTATNTPTTFRKSFGSYTLTDYTEPGWTVELYINNVIVDFTTADASGFFSFEVPLVYGASQIVLKFYGPWGEERIREQTINVPYNFLPKGTVEYQVSSGVVRDTSNAIYSRAEAGVGVHRNFTVGGGVEYLSSIKTGEAIPFLNTSLRFLRNFLFTGEYAHGVKTRGLLNYRLPSNLVFEVDYTRYVPGQKAISFNYLEERKASLSVPVKLGSIRSFARMSYKQNVLQEITYSTAEVLLSSYIYGVSANVSGFASWISEGTPYIYSNVALGFKLGRSTNFRPQAQIDITNSKLISLKAELERNFFQKAYLSLVYEENIRSDYRSVEVAFRYDLPFAQAGASARLADGRLLTTENARGSFAFGSGNGYVHVDNRSTVGRAGMVVIPFLDVNHNGFMDKTEPFAAGLNLRIGGGRILQQKSDSIIRIIELEPFASYLLELDDNSFENIAWQLDDKLYSIYIDPNQFKQVYVPVKVMGEANGMVYLKEGRRKKGQGRIIVNFFDSTGTLVHKTLSEQDGYYNYLGFAPGRYTAQVDTLQLRRLGYVSDPPVQEFEILPMQMGDIIDDLEFTLTSIVSPVETSQNTVQPVLPETNQKAAATPAAVSSKPAATPAQQVKPQDKPITTADSKANLPEAKAKQDVVKPGKYKNHQDALLELKRAKLTGQVSMIETMVFRNVSSRVEAGDVNPDAGIFTVQAGAFSSLENATRLLSQIKTQVSYPSGIIKEEGYYKVRFGYFEDAAQAVKCAEAVSKAWVVVILGVVWE
jgi:hypothetical protein